MPEGRGHDWGMGLDLGYDYKTFDWRPSDGDRTEWLRALTDQGWEPESVDANGDGGRVKINGEWRMRYSMRRRSATS